MKTPESSSGLRIARFWKTNASISMPAPATAQAISEPRIPVATPNRAGSEKTPAPTMPPTTSPVSVGTLIFPAVTAGDASVGVLMGISLVNLVMSGRDHQPARAAQPTALELLLQLGQGA